MDKLKQEFSAGDSEIFCFMTLEFNRFTVPQRNTHSLLQLSCALVTKVSELCLSYENIVRFYLTIDIFKNSIFGFDIFISNYILELVTLNICFTLCLRNEIWLNR